MRPPLFRSPFSILLMAAMVALALGLYSRASHRARPSEPVPPGCEGLSSEECSIKLGLENPTGPTEPMPPTVAAEDACIDVGYLCAALQNGNHVRLWRWPEATASISVMVPEPEGLKPDLAREFQSAAARGIRAWQGHPLPLSVRTRQEGGPSDVIVQWARTLEGGRLGRAQVEFSLAGREVRVAVLGFFIATHETGPEPRLLTPEQIEVVATHEMGHVLGLPHSDDPRDVMYPENTATRLTARDFRTVYGLYGLPNGVEVRPERFNPP